jgi:hypothetical protein
MSDGNEDPKPPVNLLPAAMKFEIIVKSKEGLALSMYGFSL